MNSNELREHVKKLNKTELAEHEQRKQTALNRIKELRQKMKDKEHQQVTLLL